MTDFPIALPPKTLEKAAELRLVPDQFQEAFIRGSGAGGQKINKTASCVWLRHLPSGVEVKVQKHREQSKNRVSAYKLLIDKIEELKKGKASERSKKLFKLRKQKQRRSKRAKEKVLEGKHHRAKLKETRRGLAS